MLRLDILDVQDLCAVARSSLTSTTLVDPRIQVVFVALVALSLGVWGGAAGWFAIAVVAGFSVSGSY